MSPGEPATERDTRADRAIDGTNGTAATANLKSTNQSTSIIFSEAREGISWQTGETPEKEPTGTEPTRECDNGTRNTYN